MDTILKYLPPEYNFDIIISQDGSFSQVADVARSYERRYSFVKFLQNPDRGPKPTLPGRESPGYYYIARHYGLALNYVFEYPYDFVIIIEEDIEVSIDFFPYMLRMRSLLLADPTLFCISGWNDNGRPGLVKNNSAVYRSDFFPGLGWMMSLKMWRELETKWPTQYWDDWLRHPEQRRGRACIFPEISRTYTFGLTDGISKGQWAKYYLEPTILNNEPVPWKNIDVTHLIKAEQKKDNFRIVLTSFSSFIFPQNIKGFV
eukprot:TRINITY_DN4661_c0_g1_i11.p1 TRINITY_DN4661_c0_g1~~TRINITY_DN4661_c0_g1_i11.p1  ORF type:complete len:259 (-),score=38.25 TRINITY_DN4661_c0_g1_i11:298-1074(-)